MSLEIITPERAREMREKWPVLDALNASARDRTASTTGGFAYARGGFLETTDDEGDA